MTNTLSDAAGLERYRRLLSARAELERDAMRSATEELQCASDRIARIAIIGVKLSRYWLPALVLVAGLLLKRTPSLFRMARTGRVIWQAVQLLRNMHR